jgi:hypothetical protein
MVKIHDFKLCMHHVTPAGLQQALQEHLTKILGHNINLGILELLCVSGLLL